MFLTNFDTEIGVPILFKSVINQYKERVRHMYLPTYYSNILHRKQERSDALGRQGA